MEEQYLAHYGVLGMKWGVRRYQNKDGSLTKAGKKRYQSGERAYKDLKKQVHNKRGELNGGSNRWRINTPIGERSKAYLNEMRDKENAYKNSKAYKEWDRKSEKILAKAEKQQASLIEAGKYREADAVYDKAWNEVRQTKPKRNFSSPYDAGVTITGFGASGRKYTNGYLKGAGKQLSLAYLADLGYSTKDAEYLVNNMLKQNRTLGFV